MQNILPLGNSDYTLSEIESIQFGILSPEEISAHAVVKIDSCDNLYDGRDPKVGGLSDPRLGCLQTDMRCQTCNESFAKCPGHMGKIDLAVPVYHVGFLKTIKKFLECVCYTCARFRLLPSDPKYKRLKYVKDRFFHAWDNAKSKGVCPYSDCESQLLPLRRSGISLYFDPKKIDKKRDRIPLSAAAAREILERISDDTCRLIGLDPINARPEWMILTVLPVPPPCVRPSVCMDFNGRGEDDLTYMLTNIIRENNAVKKNPRAVEELQNQIIAYMDNEAKAVPQQFQKSGRPIKSIYSRLKGKEGRIRGHLMGKRVDFSARTVITGDPNISIEEVGVPIMIASNLTFPEKVTRYNIDQMCKLVARGSEYPGAKFLVKKTGARFDLSKPKRMAIVEIGDTVERHMVTGDIILFNRQPTLHKMSMMAHRARIMSGETFRLNPNVTASFNADFDGDEMNLHFPQTYESMAELWSLSTVSKLLVSPQANRPVNALVQDSLYAIRKFTERDTFIPYRVLLNLCLWMKPGPTNIPPPCILKPEPLWSGKQVVSMLLPPMHLQGYHSQHSSAEERFKKNSPSPSELRQNSNMPLEDTKVVISAGVHLMGIICKKTIGTAAGGIIHIMWRDFGPDVTRDFMDNLSQVLNQWMLTQGFSVGIGDMLIRDDVEAEISRQINEQYEKTSIVLKMQKAGELAPQGNMTPDETKESQVQTFLAKARDSAGRTVAENLHRNNNIKQMVDAGSKGSILNIVQISGSVGQQIVEGRRIPFGFTGRTLPHFDYGDDSPKSRGFVENSFIKGLDPHEMFFHAMGGREGLIDTAVKTAESGYIQRRLVKALEDLMVKHDGTVRNSREDIIQFYYGEEGFDGTAIEHQVLDTLLMSNDELYKNYFMEGMEKELEQLRRDRDFLRSVLPSTEDRWALPLNIARLIKGAQDLHFPHNSEPLHKEYVFQQIMSLRQKLKPTPVLWSEDSAPAEIFGILLLCKLASRLVIQKHRLTKEQFNWLLMTIEKEYYKGLVEPGEAVGVLVAQSIGEPATQMTLNTFHSSGSGNKLVTSGIPRLNELINAVKNLQTPGMTIYLKEDWRFDKNKAKQVRNKLEHTTLHDLVEDVQILYDANYLETTIVSDKIWMETYLQIPDEDLPSPSMLQPWCLRLTLSRNNMLQKDLRIDSVVNRLTETFKGDFFILHSDDNDAEMVIQIRIYRMEEVLPFSPGEDSSEDYITKEFIQTIRQDLLTQVTIEGIPGIEKAFIAQKSLQTYNQETGALDPPRKEYIIETDGVNIRDVLRIPGIDINRIHCNDPQEMLSIFGIEVSRETLMEEIRGVIEEGGSYINHRHLSLLCDVMTNRGKIMAITRHGINKTEAGPLMKCTFEQTVDILMDAAVKGEKDRVKGVAEHIMLGKMAPIGTGSIKLLSYAKQSSIQISDDEKSDRWWMDDDGELPELPRFTDEQKTIKTNVIERTDGYNPLKPSYLKH